MTALRRSPLLLAVVLALIPAVALAVILGPLRHRTTPVANPTPTFAPEPSLSPTARTTPLPALIARDDSSIGAARAFGRIDVSGYDLRDNVSISGYTLTATPPAHPPAELPVWRLRGFVSADISGLEARLGVAPTTPEFPGDKPDGRIDVGQAQVAAGNGNLNTLLTVASRPNDDSQAVAAVARLLAELGLTPQSADAAVRSRESGPTVTWDIAYTRRAIDGIPVGFGLAGGTEVADVQITELGNVTRLSVDAPALDGGSRYPLRTWQDAWSDVSRGHWFDECCEVFTGGGGPRTATPFRADSVSIVYEQVGTTAMHLVPMYVFGDSASKLALAVPALQAADLAEPGGFRLTQPGA
jgi:hypothetical protein